MVGVLGDEPLLEAKRGMDLVVHPAPGAGEGVVGDPVCGAAVALVRTPEWLARGRPTSQSIRRMARPRRRAGPGTPGPRSGHWVRSASPSPRGRGARRRRRSGRSARRWRRRPRPCADRIPPYNAPSRGTPPAGPWLSRMSIGLGNRRSQVRSCRARFPSPSETAWASGFWRRHGIARKRLVTGRNHHSCVAGPSRNYRAARQCASRFQGSRRRDHRANGSAQGREA